MVWMNSRWMSPLWIYSWKWNGIGQRYLFINISNEGHYLGGILFSLLPVPPLPSPQQAALVNVCWQQRLPWAGCRTWGLYVFIYPSICRCQGKGKVIFCVWPTGETEANDLGHVDCYLAPRIALYFYERGPGNASRSIGWGVSTAEVEVGGGDVLGSQAGLPPAQWGRALNPGSDRSQLCGVIKLCLCVHLLIIWII